MARKKRFELAAPKAARIVGTMKDEAISYLVRLASIPTVNPPGENYGRCLAAIEKKMRALGLTVRRLKVPRAAQEKVMPGTYRDYPRANLVARWNVGARKTLHFNAHYDVVPVSPGWKTAPFTPTRRGGRLIGRGCSDMKCGLVAALMAVEALKASGETPAWNVEISATADEETGGQLGLGWLVNAKKIRPDAGVICEGASGLNICRAHKGVLWIEFEVIGKAAHASGPKNGVNAFEKAAGLVRELQSLTAIYSKRKSKITISPGRSAMPTIVFGGLTSAGNKHNTIPGRFVFSADRRILPEEKIRDVKAEILRVVERAKRKDKGLKVRLSYPLHVESANVSKDEPICKAAVAGVSAVRKRPAKLVLTAGFLDMRWLTNDGGIPSIGYGPEGGGAHSDFEWLKLASLVPTARAYAEIMMRMGR